MDLRPKGTGGWGSSAKRVGARRARRWRRVVSQWRWRWMAAFLVGGVAVALVCASLCTAPLIAAGLAYWRLQSVDYYSLLKHRRRLCTLADRLEREAEQFSIASAIGKTEVGAGARPSEAPRS